MREVHLPRSLPELWQLMEAHPGAIIYAGGTDLLIRLRKGLIDEPGDFVCLERVRELREITDLNEEIRIGAAVTFQMLMDEALILAHIPLLASAAATVGSPPIRHMGTIGGNLVNASPAGDMLPSLHILPVELEVASRTGARRVSPRDFIQGPGRVALGEGELVTAIFYKKQPSSPFWFYEKVGKRKALSIALASMAASLEVSPHGVIREARLAWGSMGPVVMTSLSVDEALAGKPLTVEALEEVIPMVREALRPVDDIRATAAYRLDLACALLLRLPQRFNEWKGRV